MHSKRRYKICIFSVILGQTEEFRNYKPGLLHYFPENFGCNSTFYESKTFSDSSLQRILSPKILGFFFLQKKELNLRREMKKI